tara:strand:- start:25 stop:225 length:201 start_codon:yes stop_codon:yes gene_type:complete
VKVEKKWLRIVSLALSLPATIFVSAWFSRLLVLEGILEKWMGAVLFLTLVCNSIFLIVFYAIKNKR